MRQVLVVLLVLVAVLVIVIATRPATFHVERSTTIAAPPAVIFGHVADLHRWPDWSPWEKLDPQMTRSYEGPESGIGSAYHWAGNDKVGEGRMTVTELVPPERAGFRLEFLKPWQSTCTSAFTLTREGAGTRVTWAMDGTNNFVAKAFTLVMSIDKSIGPDFERGLAALKSAAEAEAQAAAGSAPVDSLAPAPH